jgi:hypothetical protein
MTNTKIMYTIDMDDLIKSGMRIQLLSKISWRSRIVARIVFGILPVIGILLVPGDLPRRLIVMSPIIAACIFYFVLDLMIRKRLMAMRLRKLWSKMLGGTGPFPCEWELLEDVLRTQIAGTETRRQWANLSVIDDTEEAVEFIFRSPDLTRIPRGAFSSDQQRIAWLNFARGKLNSPRRAEI